MNQNIDSDKKCFQADGAYKKEKKCLVQEEKEDLNEDITIEKEFSKAENESKKEKKSKKNYSKGFKCDKCDKSYTWYSGLSGHKRLVHNKQKET